MEYDLQTIETTIAQAEQYLSLARGMPDRDLGAHSLRKAQGKAIEGWKLIGAAYRSCDSKEEREALSGVLQTYNARLRSVQADTIAYGTSLYGAEVKDMLTEALEKLSAAADKGFTRLENNETFMAYCDRAEALANSTMERLEAGAVTAQKHVAKKLRNLADLLDI